MAKRAVNNASRKNWAGLWPALGLTGIGTLYIAKEQLDDPGSFPNTVATRVMVGTSHDIATTDLELTQINTFLH